MFATPFKTNIMQSKVEVWRTGESYVNVIWMSKDAEKHLNIFDYPNTSKKKKYLTNLTTVMLAAFRGGIELKSLYLHLFLLKPNVLNWIVLSVVVGFFWSSFCPVSPSMFCLWTGRIRFYLFCILGFHKVMEGIHKATELGYRPVKVKGVLIYSFNCCFF